MKAVRWHDKEDIRVENIPIPTPEQDEVLIRVAFSGICGSEVHEYLDGPVFIPIQKHPVTGDCAPQTLGHEFGGFVEKLGANVRGLKVGTLVTVNPLLACGKCNCCSRNRPNLCENIAYYGLIGNGGHAQYAVVKAANCVPMPDDVPLEYVAFGEPAGVAYHAINQANMKPGFSVAVLGAGPIGQLVVQYARLAGADKVYLTEIEPYRIKIAEEIGAIDEAFNPLEVDVMEEIMKRTGGRGVNCSIECSGGERTGLLEDTASQAVELTSPEGTAVMVGTHTQPTEFHFNNVVLMERKIIGSWSFHSHEEYTEAMNMIIEGKVKVLPLISEKIRIDDAVIDGIKALHLNKGKHLKILIDFT